jgi:hypothetical protein
MSHNNNNINDDNNNINNNNNNNNTPMFVELNKATQKHGHCKRKTAREK